MDFLYLEDNRFNQGNVLISNIFGCLVREFDLNVGDFKT